MDYEKWKMEDGKSGKSALSTTNPASYLENRKWKMDKGKWKMENLENQLFPQQIP